MLVGHPLSRQPRAQAPPTLLPCPLTSDRRPPIFVFPQFAAFHRENPRESFLCRPRTSCLPGPARPRRPVLQASAASGSHHTRKYPEPACFLWPRIESEPCTHSETNSRSLAASVRGPSSSKDGWAAIPLPPANPVRKAEKPAKGC